MQENNIITIKNLSKSYGRKKVLSDISLDIAAGQVIGYIGTNGAGKSTTVRILIGLDKEFEGEVFINGYNVKKDPLAVKKIIGYIPEVAALYDVLTPMEYLNLVGQLHEMSESNIRERATQMLGFFGLTHQLDQRMDSFSKGMRQKVLIVAGLIHNPSIIFMDEPLTGLDANTVILFKEIIARLAQQGKTIFYCSHMMDIVEKVSDRIILLKDGRILADGSFAELKQQNDGSLEAIFSQLTGTSDTNTQVDGFLNAIKDAE